MLTVKLLKFGPGEDLEPSYTEAISVHECKAVHTRFETGGRCVLQLGNAPGETMEVTIGRRSDCSYSVAYVMNEAGRTIETIR